MSLLSSQYTNISSTNVLSVTNRNVQSPTSEGAYATNSVWPRFRGPSNLSLGVASVAGPNLSVGVFATGGSDDFSNSTPIVDGAGNVFILNTTGRLYKFSPAGAVLYSYLAAGVATSFSSPVINNQSQVFFGTTQGLYAALDTGSALVGGKIADIGDCATSISLLTSSGNIIIGTRNGLYCVTPTGTVVWANTSILGNNTGEVANGWNLALDLDTNTVYLTTINRFYVINAATGATKNETYVGLLLQYSVPVVGPSLVYVGSEGGLIAFTKEGNVSWINRSTGDCYDASPAYSEARNTVYIGSVLFALNAVDGTTGATIFQVDPNVTSIPLYNSYSSCLIDSKGSVYIYKKMTPGVLMEYNGVTGATLSSNATGNISTSTYITLALGPNGKLYGGASAGLLISP